VPHGPALHSEEGLPRRQTTTFLTVIKHGVVSLILIALGTEGQIMSIEGFNIHLAYTNKY